MFSDVKNEPYMKIEREILSSRLASARAATSSPRLSLPSHREDIAVMRRELEHLRRRCSELTEEKSSIRLFIMFSMILIISYFFKFRNELASAQRQITQIRLPN